MNEQGKDITDGASTLRARFEATDQGREPIAARVLLAEDNPINQRLMKIKLEEFGLDVDVASDGHQAIEAFQRQRYDLVLMDVSMPGLDGIQATEAIKATGTGRSVPVVALTAHSLKGDRQRLVSQGMDDYLPKPVDFDRLYDLLRKYLPARGSVTEALRRNAPVTQDEAQDLLTSFVAHARESIETLRDSLRNLDQDRIFRISHNLRGTAGNLGLQKISRLAGQLEGRDVSSQETQSRLDLLESEVQRLGDSLIPDRSGVPGDF